MLTTLEPAIYNPSLPHTGGGNCSGSLEVAACLTARGQRIDFEVETFAVHAPEVAPCLQTTCDDYSRADGFTAIVETATPVLAFHSNAQPDQMRFDPHVSATLTVSQTAAVAYAIQAGALRTNPDSGPDGVGVQPNIAYTLEARAEVQAVAFSCKDYGGDASVELAPTMRAMGHGGSHANAGGQLAVAAPKMRVRRLMPVECERLQAFPDDHTRIPIRRLTPARVAKLQARGVLLEYIDGEWWELAADGPRYKALGNSMCVFVMRWLGARLMATHPQVLRLNVDGPVSIE